MATKAFHFPEDTQVFLAELAANNNRDWFTENKARYEAAVKAPGEIFADEMVSALSDMIGQPMEHKIIRIYRDVRFSKDKTPYNTHLRMAFWTRSENKSAPAWFFSLEGDQLNLGAGTCSFNKAPLEPIRERIDSPEGDKLARIWAKLGKDGIRQPEPEYKRVPKGYDTNHPHADLLRLKDFAGWIDLPGTGQLSKGDAVKTCLKEYKRLKPLTDWLLAPYH